MTAGPGSLEPDLDRFLGCLLGLAAGDALGTTLEFKPPGTFEPITDMVGRGPFRLAAGQWTDDTSMALCLAESLIETADLVSQYRWRHFVTVERILGFKPGTGGSAGVGWLRNIVDHRFFPELWSIRTDL